MIFRDCAGGIVFYANQVLIIRNEKNEWVLPKGKIRSEDSLADISVKRVKEETNINAEVLSLAGETSYEFFSISRQEPVCNKITWYIMSAKNKDIKLNNNLDYKEIGFFKIDEALEKITYSQDKSLVNLSYKKYKNLMKEKI